jgi:serine/threonine protein kinase
LKRQDEIYMIDFGIAKRYLDPKTGNHIKFKTGRGIVGTYRYSSLNASSNFEQSRRDDLEGLGYVLAHQLLKGQLPWRKAKAATFKLKYEKVRELKESVSFADLFDGFPLEFARYMQYCRQLAFEATPDYSYLRGLFASYLDRLEKQGEPPQPFDWILKREELILECCPEKLQEYSGLTREEAELRIKKYNDRKNPPPVPKARGSIFKSPVKKAKKMASKSPEGAGRKSPGSEDKLKKFRVVVKVGEMLGEVVGQGLKKQQEMEEIKK